MAYNLPSLFLKVRGSVASSPRVSLGGLAKSLRVDRHTVHKSITAMTGMSFRQFRREVMLQKACQLLGQPGLSVKQVSFQLGFSSPQAFSHFTRGASGLSPGQLRAAAQQGVAFKTSL